MQSRPESPSLQPSIGSGSAPDARFVRLVRDALTHLHDLPYLQTHPLAELASTTAAGRVSSAGRALQSSLSRAIESLQPGRGDTADSHARRTHALLVKRYVDGEPIASVAADLGISESEFYRDQQRAIAAVASVLWESWRQLWLEADSRRGRLSPQPDGQSPIDSAPVAQASGLPLPLTSFVGREAERGSVADLLRSARLVTLTGPAGCGKTRLAVEIARSLADRYPDGLWLVDLAGLCDPGQTAQVVASTVGCPGDQSQPILSALGRYLARKRALLVLDNCEHLVAACAELAATLLQACPSLALLATSRERLMIPGEHVVAVPSLSLPPTDAGIAPEGLLEYDAPRLFRDRAVALDATFEVTARNAAAVATICARLDGIPLAIELASARLRAVPVEELAVRLGDRFRLLSGGNRTAPPRQQSLAAMVEWSYALLSDEEASLFRRLSVFAGGFSLEAAEAVGGCDPSERETVLQSLGRLVDKSMVVADGSSAGGPRYHLLETLRAFGIARLEESGEAEFTRGRCCEYFTALAERAEPELTGPRQVEWLTRLALDAHNLRQALQWLLDRPEADAALRLAGALWHYWEMRSGCTEGRVYLRAALAKTRQAGRAPPALTAKAHQGAGALALMQGDYHESLSLLQQSAAQFRALGDRRETAWTLIYLGWAMNDGGDPVASRPVLEEALTIARVEGHHGAAACALNHLGQRAFVICDFATAVRWLEEGVQLAKASGDLYSVALSQNTLASTYECGFCEPEEGVVERLELEAIQIWRSLGARRNLTYSLYLLGHKYSIAGRASAAEPLLREGLLASIDLGDPYGMILGCLYFGTLAQFAEAPDRAMRLLGAALAAQEPTRITLPPVIQAWCSRIRAGCVPALGTAAAEAALAAGRTMTLEHAVDYALGR